MTYPISEEVTPGQPTASAHYNNLRRDALRLGNADVDSLTIAGFLNRHFEHMNLQYLATNRVRVPHSINQPPTLMINGCLLQATASVDLPSNQFTGVAALWYIFAVRTPGSTTFTLAVNTAAAEATDQRLIGECYWDGENILVPSIKCYFQPVLALSAADYDSGWFAVTTGATYTKNHMLAALPPPGGDLSLYRFSWILRMGAGARGAECHRIPLSGRLGYQLDLYPDRFQRQLQLHRLVYPPGLTHRLLPRVRLEIRGAHDLHPV